MKRRSIIAALMAGCVALKPQDLTINGDVDEFILFALDMTDTAMKARSGNSNARIYMLAVTYNGETVKFTPEEVMAALR